MSLIIDCRLCDSTCNDFKRLYDEQQQCIAGLHEIAAKYFHPMFLTRQEEAEVTALCMQCWSRIVDFNDYQQNVFQTQAKLRNKRKRKNSNETNKAKSRKVESAVKVTQMPTMPDDNIVKTEYEFSNYQMPTIRIETQTNVAIKKEINNFNTDNSPINIVMQPGNLPNISTPTFEIKDEALEEISTCNSDIEEDSADNIIKKLMKNPKIELRHLTENERIEIVAAWQPRLKCCQCPLDFPNFPQLNSHFLRSHAGQTFYYECCKSKFKYYALLVEHALIHLNPRIFKCESCKKCFQQQRYLKRHVSYTCTPKVQNEAEKCLTELRVAKENVTPSEMKLYRCLHCPKTFRYGSSVQQHQKTKHPLEWQELNKNITSA